MSTSHTAAVHLVPLMARIVLCAAFLPMGYQKLFDRAPIDAAQMARLEAMGWEWTPPARDGATAVPSTPPAPSAPVTPAPDATKPAGAPDAATPAEPITTAPPSDRADAPLTVRRLEMLAFVIADSGLPAPRVTAWLVAIIELVGGALVLIGLFTRLAALGLVGIMAGAIHTTSLAALMAHPFIFGMPLPDYQRFFLQVGLLTLALGVLLTGPGGFSADRAIFSSSRSRPRGAAPRAGGSAGA